ncbi:MAG TPA: RagB/SusD family nutrient uptake outer membrane protein [Cyclobacteriaceae bacterium]
MKKIAKITLAYTLLFIMSACSDKFLDLKAPSVSEDTFFETEQQASLALIGCYDVLGWDDTSYFPFWLGDILGHDSYKGGEGPGDNPWIEPLLVFDYSNNNPGLPVPFQQYYIGINRCNRVIDKVGVMTDEMIDPSNKNQIVAEARFLRGYYYFELVKIFGEVPLVDHLLAAGNYNLPKATFDQLWKFIEDDFKAAISVLPVKSQQVTGRATKGAAQAFLCKAYVYEKNWSLALSTADEIIASNEYSLESNYSDNWLLSHENGAESVFEIQFASSGTDAWGNDNEGNEYVIFMRSRNNGDGWGFSCPKQTFVDRFEAGDPRRDATIIDDGEQLTWTDAHAKGDTVIADNQFTSCIDGYMSQKQQIAPSQWGLQSDDPNDWILIRYSEVLLWAAEAAAHIGGDWNSYLQQVRDRVGMGATPESDPLKAVYHEREVELGMEGQRLWDIIRQGRGEEILGQFGYVEGKNNYLPIPQSQLTFIKE